ncbi:MAG: hypothetical protein IPM96_21045 [Ignavibacteria bacterium]|nr:hypothetical protein [Ignavibacteria bacterium]
MEIITIANLGYADIFLLEKTIKKQRENYFNALKYAEQLYKISAVRFNRCLNSVYNNLSVFYFQLNNLKNSNNIMTKSIKLLENCSLKNISDKIDLANTLMFKCDCLETNSSKKKQTAKKVVRVLEKIENNLRVNILRARAKKNLS